MKWKFSQTIDINYRSSINIGILPIFSRIPQNSSYQRRIGVQSNHNSKIIKSDNEYITNRVKLVKRGLAAINLDYAVETKGINLINEDWGYKTEIISEEYKVLIAETKFWRKIEEIQEVAFKLKEDIISSNDHHSKLKYLVKQIFDFVKETIAFKENQDTRFGAVKALRLKYGDCDELSDLFIAICRNLNIPARRVTGYFIKPRENIAEAHAWAEILDIDNNRWIPIDPALNFFGSLSPYHIIFAFDNGASRESFVWSQKNIKGHLKLDISPLEIVSTSLI